LEKCAGALGLIFHDLHLHAAQRQRITESESGVLILDIDHEAIGFQPGPDQFGLRWIEHIGDGDEIHTRNIAPNAPKLKSKRGEMEKRLKRRMLDLQVDRMSTLYLGNNPLRLSPAAFADLRMDWRKARRRASQKGDLRIHRAFRNASSSRCASG
jgi:hypothetical protein